MRCTFIPKSVRKNVEPEASCNFEAGHTFDVIRFGKTTIWADFFTKNGEKIQRFYELPVDLFLQPANLY